MRFRSRLASFILVFLAAPAFGHVTLDHAEPKVGSKTHGSPTVVKIWFSDDVELRGTSVEVFDASGNRVDKADLHADPKDQSIVIISLSERLPAGIYKVAWRALCQDKHKTKGDFRFELTK